MSDLITIAGSDKVYSGRDTIPILDGLVRAGREAIEKTTPIDGALAAAKVPLYFGVAATGSALLFRNQRSLAAIARNIGASAGIIGASMVTGFAGEGLKSLMISQGKDSVEAAKTGHLIAGIGIGGALLGAAKILPASSAFRPLAFMSGLYSLATGVMNFGTANHVSKLEDVLEQAMAS